MDLNRSMRKGSFDKESPDDISHIDPSSWYKHFSDLLSKKVEVDPIIETYINENKDMFESELGTPFSKEELLVALKDLKNNKSTSMDQVSNEMLKTGGLILSGTVLFLFNKILKVGFYPSLWSLVVRLSTRNYVDLCCLYIREQAG